MAWEYGGADFQSRSDKSTGQALEMKAGGAAGFVTHGRFVAILLILLVAGVALDRN